MELKILLTLTTGFLFIYFMQLMSHLHTMLPVIFNASYYLDAIDFSESIRNDEIDLRNDGFTYGSGSFNESNSSSIDCSFFASGLSIYIQLTRENNSYSLL